MEISTLLLTILAVTLVDHSDSSRFRSIKYKDISTDSLALQCVPGKRFRYDHNYCYCNEDGSEITCERKMYSTLFPELHRSHLQNVSIACVPGRQFNHLCKECICDARGNFALCVNSECLDKQSRKQSTFVETRNKCVPGSVFNENCNGCICGSDFKASCTNLNCGTIGGNDDGVKCVPASQTMFDCNKCMCSKDGKSLYCSKMGCSPMTFFHQHILNITVKCEADSIFDYNCHKCACNKNEKYAICSGVQCPNEYNLREVEDTIDKCNPGMIFASDCNICVCGSNGKGACTTLRCDIPYCFNYVK